MVHTSLPRLGATRAVVFVCVLAACGQSEAPGPRIEVAVAPLTLDGIKDAVWDVRVSNGVAEVVWERRITSARYGDGAGALTYVGPCDASSPAHAPHTIDLWLVGAYTTPWALNFASKSSWKSIPYDAGDRHHC